MSEQDLVLRPILKRAFDVVIATFALIVAMPLFVAIAVAIKGDSRGPVFYRVRRVGLRGQAFMMFKFRKMYDDATGLPLTANSDPRLTLVGNFLTRTRLDELPQLWDVLCGRMSIVGPRPEDPSFVALHPDAYQRILTVRPGITGFSQIAFSNEREILNERDILGDYVDRILPQKIGLDSVYARSYRLGTDLYVIWWTVVTTVLRRPVAVHRGDGRMNLRKRPMPKPESELATITEVA